MSFHLFSRVPAFFSLVQLSLPVALHIHLMFVSSKKAKFLTVFITSLSQQMLNKYCLEIRGGCCCPHLLDEHWSYFRLLLQHYFLHEDFPNAWLPHQFLPSRINYSYIGTPLSSRYDSTVAARNLRANVNTQFTYLILRVGTLSYSSRPGPDSQ